MAGVMEKFIIASMFMWIVPVAILYGFNHELFPGWSLFWSFTSLLYVPLGVIVSEPQCSSDLSSSSLTLLSGFLAVISVNVVIAFYICLAMREPMQKHEPDPKFLSEATASVKQFKPDGTAESSSTHKKEE